MKTIKIYIAGKVTGEDYQQCFDKFQAIEATLTGLGYHVLNPMRIVKQGTPWMDAMETLRPHLINANVALFLPDWHDSQGCIEERIIAMNYNVEIVDYRNLNEFLNDTCSV